MRTVGFRAARGGYRWRHAAWRVALCCAVVAGAGAATLASAQEVAPRLTGQLVIDQLGKVTQAVAARAKAEPDPDVDALHAQMVALAAALDKALGADAGQPVATIDAGKRDAVVRANAAAMRVKEWLAASAVACTRDDVKAMLVALASTVTQLGADTASQKAPLPIINGVETIDRRPLFVLRPAKGIPRFVLTGENLVDAQCANPQVVAVDASGKPAAQQPQLVAAQAGRVEMRWPQASTLAPGSYTLRLTAQRKAFLVGCVSEPPALAVLQVAPPASVRVTYALVGTCQGSATPVPLASGVLNLDGPGQTASRNVSLATCPQPVSYTLTAATQVGNGPASKVGPVTQGADAAITTGLGDGLTLVWQPALGQLFARSDKQGCKGVY